MAQIDDAEQDYLNGMKYKDIAEKYGVSMNTVKSWRRRHGWQRGEVKRGAPDKLRGAPKKNKYATGNPGGSAPNGNKNAVTTGRYETITLATMTDEERTIFEQASDDPLTTINTQIRELKVRQYRIMQRIEQRRLKKESLSKTIDYDIAQGKMVPKSATAKHNRLFDDLNKLDEALNVVNSALLRATDQKQRLVDSTAAERKRVLAARAIIAEAEAAKVERDNNDLGVQKQMHNMSMEELRRLASDRANSGAS